MAKPFSSKATVAVAVLLLLAGAAGWYTFGRPQAASDMAASAPAAPPAFAVEAAEVQAKTLSREISAVGTTRSNESVVIRPEIAGRIAAFHFDEGGLVEVGQKLVSLDASVYEAELRQAEASLSLSRRNYQRAAELLSKGAGTARTRDESLSQMEVDEAAVALAKARLDKTVILAPFSGVVGLRMVSVGDYVGPGQDIVNLEDIDPIKVDFRVPEALLSVVSEGQRLRVTLDAFPDRTFEGTVYAIDPRIDREGRSILIRARIPNADGVLRPGLFARVTLIVDTRTNALVVPEQAIVPRENEHFVFRIVDGTAKLTKVELGQRRAGEVEIVNGLNAGDTVVTSGQLRLRDGSAVRVVPPAGKA